MEIRRRGTTGHRGIAAGLTYGLACGLMYGFAIVLSAPSLAGPPFLTDDPVPVEPGHWEINNFAAATFANGAASGALPGIDANYGAAENVQLHLQAAMAFATWSGSGTQYGFGDTEIGVKYRFLPASDNDWWPQLAFYPFLDFPTGNAGRDLGTGDVHAFLPLWLQKDVGKWTAFGGGGYWINPGAGNRSYWFVGGVLQYHVTAALTLGGELYHQTSSATGGPGSAGYPLGSEDTTGFNVGGTYDFNKTYHLLFSAGRGLENVSATNVFSYYLALQVTY
jgi:hypothetical protein